MAKPFHLAGARFAGVVLAGLLCCSVAGAQRGGGARGGGGFRSAPARSFSSRGFSSARTPQVYSGSRAYSSGFTPGGLPFNYPALNGNFRFNPPGTTTRGFGRRGSRGPYVPVVIWGGVPYYFDCLDYDECPSTLDDQDAYAPYASGYYPQAPAPQVVVVQQPVPVAQPAANTEDSWAPAVAAPAPEPLQGPENSGFVLIRRNGQVLFASAYTVIGTNIRYVTPEGLVRTVALADLDMGSTRSMNEARGVTVPN